MSKQNKQSVTYKPQINYTDNYYTKGENVSQSDVSTKRKSNRLPLDSQSIPQIGENIEYLNSALKALPKSLYNAIREIYDPIKDIYYETLIDKIVDPNLREEPIKIIPPNQDSSLESDSSESDSSDSSDNKGDKKKPIRPIVLKPREIKESSSDSSDDIKPPIYDKEIHPIELRAVQDESEESDSRQPIQTPTPIILLPIVDYEYGSITPQPPGGYDDEEDGDDPEMWDPPDIDIIYKYPEIRKQIDKEFVYLLTKIALYYTEKLKDAVNNYIYNVLRNNIDMDDEKLEFVHSKLEISSNDILNHSKHLLDITIKNEDMSTLKINFFKNNFNVKYTTTHIKSFYVSNELRARYTDISYSRGGSMVNSVSDALLKQMHSKYELQYRNDFENLFRYINSSLKVISDILGTLIEQNTSKATLAKKNGRRTK